MYVIYVRIYVYYIYAHVYICVCVKTCVCVCINMYTSTPSYQCTHTYTQCAQLGARTSQPCAQYTRPSPPREVLRGPRRWGLPGGGVGLPEPLSRVHRSQGSARPGGSPALHTLCSSRGPSCCRYPPDRGRQCANPVLSTQPRAGAPQPGAGASHPAGGRTLLPGWRAARSPVREEPASQSLLRVGGTGLPGKAVLLTLQGLPAWQLH